MSYLKVSDVARELGVSRSAAYEIMKEMPRLMHRRIVRVSSEAFRRWLEQKTVAPARLDAGDERRAARIAVQLAARAKGRRSPSDGAGELRIRQIQPRTMPRSPDGVRPSMRSKANGDQQ